MKRLKNILKLLFEAFKDWVRNRAKVLAPSIAYYQLLSISPLVGFVIFISHKVLGPVHVKEEVIPLLKSIVSPQLTKVIVYFLSTKKHMELDDLYTIPLLSGLLLIWAGKGYFSSIKQIILLIYNQRQQSFGVMEKLKRDFSTVKIALVSVSIVVFFVFLRTWLPYPYTWGNASGPVGSILVKVGEWSVGFLVVFTLRVFYFTYIPPVKVNWRYTLPGAALGAILFLIGREIMETHFSERPHADTAESILMVMLWFYYSGLVFIYSAEFTKLYVVQKQGIDIKNLHFKIK